MPEFSNIFLFRMTHIENIPHVLQYGITHSTSVDANPAFVPIGDSSLIRARSQFVLDNGKCLGQYIPFYFGLRMPMLYVIQKGYNMVKPTPAEDIVYCISNIGKIMESKLDFIFTDGHAVDSFSTQYGIEDVRNIGSLLDLNAINERYWKNENDLDLKRRKEAEFLVCGDIPISAITGYIVYNGPAKQKLCTFGVHESMVQVCSKYYF